jgi:hypothetical protein
MSSHSVALLKTHCGDIVETLKLAANLCEE